MDPVWISFLSSTAVFHDLSDEALRQLGDQFEWIELKAGEILIRRGDPGDSMYLIVSGQVQVLDPDSGPAERILAELGPGDVVGEMALWTSQPRFATIRTSAATSLGKLGRRQFDAFSKTHPETARAIDRLVRQRLRKNQLSAALRVSKLFGDLEEAALRALEAELEVQWIEGGKALFRRGEAGDALYLVLGGKLKVLAENAGEEPGVLAEIGRGETIGEMAVLDGEPRSATVVAARDSQVARLSKEGLARLTSGREELLGLIARELSRRLRAVEAPTRRRSSATITLAVVPASGDFSAGSSFDEFSNRLGAAFAKIGPVLLISSASLDALVGTRGAAQVDEHDAGHGRMIDLLDKLEADHRFVIYQVDAEPSAWTRRCLRHCDQVLLVVAGGDATVPVRLDLLQTLPERGGPTVSLALLHADSKHPPSGTSRLLAQVKMPAQASVPAQAGTPAQARTMEQHYHLRLDGEHDFDRLARSLSGNAIGLVLSGGAARGLAHAGVIRALAEAGVPVDMVGGTSQGAIMGAIFALGWGHERILERNIQGWEAMVRDKTFPIISFLSGRHLAEFVHAQVGDTEIEDLWLPFFCVAANLTRARMEVMRRGPLAKSLLTSARVPGIYPPIVWDGDLLVDGGILNNVPVDVMRASVTCGRVIASDVSPRIDMPGFADYGLAVTGWRAMLEWLRPASKRQRFPSAYSVLLRTVEFGGAANAAKNIAAADLYLRPPMGDFKVGEYQRGPEMAEDAFRYAREKIAEWLAARGGQED
jgi:predicted acylesterase/phospholipase RssA/CRP-like cAMP-binding protein